MKKIYFLLLGLALWSCSDGDLQIETLDFDSVAIQNCDAVSTATTVFFKINGDETLILELKSGLLKNEVSTETIESSIPGQSKLIYRAFDGNVSGTYFCGSIPPTEPNVIEEIEASNGTILITTTTEDAETFTHNIQFQDIILINSLGEQIIDLTINDFGTVETSTN